MKVWLKKMIKVLPLTYSGFEVYGTGVKITDETASIETKETKDSDSDS